MFREMLRKNKMIDEKECFDLLDKAEYGILTTVGDEDYPYSVPVNYSVVENQIIVHCAYKGHKIDAIKKDSRVSFTVVLSHEIVAEKFSSNFESIIAFGRATIVEDIEEKNEKLFSLIEKYSQDFKEEGRKYIDRAGKNTCLIAIDIEHISGKRSRR